MRRIPPNRRVRHGYQVSQKKSEVVKQPSTRTVSFTEPEIDLATSSDATIQSNAGKVLPKMGNVQSGHQNERERERRRIMDDTIAEFSKESFDEDAQPTIGETSISTTEAVAIRAEVREIMRQKYAEG